MIDSEPKGKTYSPNWNYIIIGLIGFVVFIGYMIVEWT